VGFIPASEVEQSQDALAVAQTGRGGRAPRRRRTRWRQAASVAQPARPPRPRRPSLARGAGGGRCGARISRCGEVPPRSIQVVRVAVVHWHQSRFACRR